MEIYSLHVAEFARIRVFATVQNPNSGEFGYMPCVVLTLAAATAP